MLAFRILTSLWLPLEEILPKSSQELSSLLTVFFRWSGGLPSGTSWGYLLPLVSTKPPSVANDVTLTILGIINKSSFSREEKKNSFIYSGKHSLPFIPNNHLKGVKFSPSTFSKKMKGNTSFSNYRVSLTRK